MSKGLQLDDVFLVGRTYDEYARYFELDGEARQGRVLDMGAGVSSFCAEMRVRHQVVVAADPIYRLSADTIEDKCRADLEEVVDRLPAVADNYRWGLYGNLDGLKRSRERAYRAFLPHYARQPGCYVAATLPRVPFADGTFTLSLVSYLLFLYERLLDYEFHKESLLELTRVTDGEVRVYPLVTLDAERSSYVERLLSDPDCRHLSFEVRKVPFEFLVGADELLCVQRLEDGRGA